MVPTRADGWDGYEPLEGGVVHVGGTTLLGILHEAPELGRVIAPLDAVENAGSIRRRHVIGILIWRFLNGQLDSGPTRERAVGLAL